MSILSIRYPLFKIIFLLMLPLAAVSILVKFFLFNAVSYTNSEKLDVSIESIRLIGDEIDVIVMGSSEILYGINPLIFNEVGKEKSCNIKAFNLAVEGFGPSHYEILMEKLPLRKWMPQASHIIFGVNGFEAIDSHPLTRKAGFDCERMAGDLQRSVFTSAMGRDTGLADLCPIQSETHILKGATQILSDLSPIFRHRKSIRELILSDQQIYQAKTEEQYKNE